MRAKFGSGKIIALVFDIVILAFLLLWLNSTETGLSPAVLIICVVIFLFYAFSMVLKPKRIWRGIPTILTAELGFSLFYFVLFYLAYVRDLLGLSPYWKNSMISHTFPEGANQAILLATIGFVAFHAGTLLFPAQAYRYSSTEMESQNNSYPLFDAILTVVQIMLSACFWIFGLRSSDIDRYGISDRAQAVQIQASSAVGGNAIVDGLYLLTLVCCFLSISRVVYSLALQRRLSRLQLVMAVNVVAWAMYILLSGDRNNFLLIALAGAGGIAAFVRRINWTAIFIFIAGALFMYQTIEVTRQMRDASFSEFISALTDSASGDEERSSSFDGTGLGLRATFSVAPNPVAFAYGYYGR